MAAGSNLLTRTTLPGGAISARTAVGELVWKIEGSVVFLAIDGTCDLSLTNELLAAVESVLALEAPMLVSFGAHQEGFSPEGRARLSEWATKKSPQIASFVLVRSKIVRMVISVLTMLARSRLELFSEVNEFDAVVNRALPTGVRNPHLERHLSRR